MTENHTPDKIADSNSTPDQTTETNASGKGILIGLIALTLLLITGLVFATIYLVGHPAQTEVVRDVFIIFLALEFILIGAALVILIIQVARLTTLLETEIKPILLTTNETISTLRGTSRFLSDNLVSPVVKANSSFAALRRIYELINPRK